MEGSWVAVVKEACQKTPCVIDDSTSLTFSQEVTLRIFQKNFLHGVERESPQEKQHLV